MKKVVVFFLSTLIGCSIIPDGSFENIPNANLVKITITANTGMDPIYPTQELDPDVYPKKTATVDVTTTDSKITMEWSGDLDLFWFTSPVLKTEYEFNSKGLITKLSVVLESGTVQTEEFTYNTDNHLSKIVTDYETYHAEHDFYYEDGQLDSIAKATLFEATPLKGFYKRNYLAGDEETKFTFVYPYSNVQTVTLVENNRCGIFVPANDNDENTSFFTFSSGNQNLESKVIIPESNEEYYYSKSDLVNETTQKGEVQQIRVRNREADFVCNAINSPSINFYSLLDPLNPDYQLLPMLTMVEEVYVVSFQPGRLTKYADLTLDYEYVYEE